MQIRKLIKYLPIAFMAAGLVLATSTPPLFLLNNHSTKNSVNTNYYTNNTQTNTVRVLSDATTLLDLDKVTKNITWPNDMYASTDGYYYMPSAGNSKMHVYQIERPPAPPTYTFDLWKSVKNDWLFKINETGFIVNSGKKYNYVDNFIYDASQYNGAYILLIDIPFIKSISANLQISSSKLNSISNTYEIGKISDQMTYGDISNYGNEKLTIASQFMSRQTPFFKFNIPIPRYLYQRVSEKTGKVIREWATHNSNSESTAKIWNSSANDVASYDWGTSLLNSVEYKIKSRYEGDLEVAKIELYSTQISIFNDYNGDVLNKTYMTKNGSNFNSVLSNLEIDESLLDKTNTAGSQDLNKTGLVKFTAQDVGLNHVKDAFTVTVDDSKGELTFAVKPSHIFENGQLVTYTGPGLSKTISGFVVSKTKFMVKADYPQNIVVDKWRSIVAVSDTTLDPEALSIYLDWEYVPDGSNYIISNFNQDLVSGVATFKINSTKNVDMDGIEQDSPSPIFNISLQLTPRITKFIATTDNDDLLVTDCYSRIFNEAGLVNLTEFNKYAEIIAPVDNADYYLVPDSYDIHTGDGTASFKIYADKFYNINADETVGGIDVVDSHFSVILNLKPLDSIMQVKNGYAADIRVDKFIDSLGTIGADGVIADPTILKQYIDLENIPSTAQYKISNIKDGDFNKQFIRNDITFDLTVTDFNQADGTVTPQTKTLTLTLGDQHMTTDIVLLDASLFPKDATPTKFKARMEKDGAVDTDGTLTLTTANIEFLSKFLDFNSIPQDTVHTLTYNPVVIDTASKLGFSLNINQYYDTNSDLLTIPKDYTFVLDLASEDYIPDPTILVTHAGSPVVNTEKDFLEQVYFDQKADLHNLSLYVDGLGTIPTTADITIIKHQDSYNKVATFMIEVSGYYDGESSQMQTTAKAFNFNVNVNVDMNPDPFSWWWWLVIAIGVAGIIALLIWIPMHKWKEIKESDLL